MLGARTATFNSREAPPPGMQLPAIWIDADDLSTIELNGNQVIGMKSKRGSVMYTDTRTMLFSNIFTRGTSRNPPILVENGLNGKNYLSFDGTMGLQSKLSNDVFKNNAITFSIVYQKTSNVLNTALTAILGASQSSSFILSHIYATNQNRLAVYKNSNYAMATNDPIIVNEWVIAMVDVIGLSSPTVNIRIFDTAASIGYGGTISNANEQYLFSIGATNNGDLFTGNIAEIMIHNFQLSAAQRQTVYNYLSSKYNILPS